MSKITDAFQKMKAALEHRELWFKQQYEMKVKDKFHLLSQESQKIRHVFTEVDVIYQAIIKLQNLLSRVDDYTVVGACSRINLLEDSYKILQQKLIA